MITPFQLQHWFISLHLPPPYDRTPSVLPAGDLFQTNRQTNKQTERQTNRNKQPYKGTNKKQTDKQTTKQTKNRRRKKN